MNFLLLILFPSHLLIFPVALLFVPVAAFLAVLVLLVTSLAVFLVFVFDAFVVLPIPLAFL